MAYLVFFFLYFVIIFYSQKATSQPKTSFVFLLYSCFLDYPSHHSITFSPRSLQYYLWLPWMKLQKNNSSTTLLNFLVANNDDNKKNKDKDSLHTFLNHYSYLIARKKPHLFSCFDHIGYDGVFLCHAVKIIGIHQKRTSFDMTSAAFTVLSNANESGKSIVIIGSKGDVSKLAAKKLKNKFPQLNITACYSGYFISEDHKDSVRTEIIELQPDIVICGMGTPFQEEFLVAIRQRGWTGTGYTCGGFLHQIAQKGINYYPNIINKYNLRWLYRIYDEPKLVRRYTYDAIRFICFFTKDVVLLKLFKHT